MAEGDECRCGRCGTTFTAERFASTHLCPSCDSEASSAASSAKEDVSDYLRSEGASVSEVERQADRAHDQVKGSFSGGSGGRISHCWKCGGEIGENESSCSSCTGQSSSNDDSETQSSRVDGIIDRYSK